MSSSVLSVPELNEKRRKAVQLRLNGDSLAQVSKECGLSAPTIIAAMKAFREGGWLAIDVKPRGRPSGAKGDTGSAGELGDAFRAEVLGRETSKLWTTQVAQDWISQYNGKSISIQATSTLLRHWRLAPINRPRPAVTSTSAKTQHWLKGNYADFAKQAKKRKSQILWLGTNVLISGEVQLYAHNLRGLCYWQLFSENPSAADYQAFCTALSETLERSLALVLPTVHLANEPTLGGWLKKTNTLAITANGAAQTTISQNTLSNSTDNEKPMTSSNALKVSPPLPDKASLTHLQRLEAESIHIMREVVAETENPVMLYSVGKDSAVMLHLAMKAFYPAKPPFPLLHVDTTWKFQSMYEFRDRMVKELGLELLTHTNEEGIKNSVNPFTHGSALHTDIMKTEALKQALDKYGFDAAFGGARRDEEKSRAKERVFSLRTAQHRWDPKAQRPEPWALYNTRKKPGESIRVFPLSNWTELDIWQYINAQDIPIVPLYSAAERPVVERDGKLIMVDDERMPLNEGEVPMMRKIRFRTLGCYPLTAAVESEATSVTDIIQEMLLSKTSEREGRTIDHDSAASMEKKKQEGYF